MRELHLITDEQGHDHSLADRLNGHARTRRIAVIRRTRLPRSTPPGSPPMPRDCGRVERAESDRDHIVDEVGEVADVYSSPRGLTPGRSRTRGRPHTGVRRRRARLPCRSRVGESPTYIALALRLQRRRRPPVHPSTRIRRSTWPQTRGLTRATAHAMVDLPGGLIDVGRRSHPRHAYPARNGGMRGLRDQRRPS